MRLILTTATALLFTACATHQLGSNSTSSSTANASLRDSDPDWNGAISTGPTATPASSNSVAPQRAAVSSKVRPSGLSSNDFFKLIAHLEGCNIGLTLSGVNEDLFVRLFGAKFLRNQIPKASTEAQNNFIRLALEGQTLPSPPDQQALLKYAFGDCYRFDASYDSADMRRLMADDYQRRLVSKAAIESGRVTYSKIAETLTDGYENSEPLFVAPGFADEVKKDPERFRDAVARYNLAMQPAANFFQKLDQKYELSKMGVKLN